jgi:N-acetylglucosamine-6-phosphate deacetylase
MSSNFQKHYCLRLNDIYMTKAVYLLSGTAGAATNPYGTFAATTNELEEDTANVIQLLSGTSTYAVTQVDGYTVGLTGTFGSLSGSSWAGLTLLATDGVLTLKGTATGLNSILGSNPTFAVGDHDVQ